MMMIGIIHSQSIFYFVNDVWLCIQIYIIEFVYYIKTKISVLFVKVMVCLDFEYLLIWFVNTDKERNLL